MHALPSIPCLGLTRSTRIGLILVGFCLSALPVHSATAQENAPPPMTERDVQARRLFEQGREAYSDGRYRDAWAYFHEAYQLSGRPELLFNIGQTADRLGQEGDAYRAFSMYLERLPDAANRKDVENRVRALHDRLEASQQAQTQPPPASAPPTHPAPAQQAPAAATQAPVAAPRQPLPTPPAVEPRTREPRRGFLLRAAIGAGYRSDSWTLSGTDNLGIQRTLDANMSGFGLALDIGAGWGVTPGFAIGGAVFLDFIGSPTITNDINTNEVKLDSAQLVTVGPFIDWYPVRKTLGWYILGGIGISVLTYKGDNLEGDGTGFGLALGTGYEFSLGPTIGLGIELRFLTAILAESDVGDGTTSHVLTAPSLLASFTWF